MCPQISFLKLEIDQGPQIYKNSLNNYFLDLGFNKNNLFPDVSNYLSYEMGQPTHCYDASKINNKLIFHEIKKNEDLYRAIKQFKRQIEDSGVMKELKRRRYYH